MPFTTRILAAGAILASLGVAAGLVKATRPALLKPAVAVIVLVAERP
ncbi:hypothetical protein [Phreatobacter sp.]